MILTCYCSCMAHYNCFIEPAVKKKAEKSGSRLSRNTENAGEWKDVTWSLYHW